MASTDIADAPVVTVLMSCYNGARWLGDAIESVLRQTYRRFEFVIVDDGSTDDSSGIIRRFAERDERIVAVTKRNTGLADSLNAGIHRARGHWIARLDADDICEPERLDVQLDRALAESNLVFVGSGMAEVDAEGVVRRTYAYPLDHARLVRNLRNWRRFPPHSSVLFRTSAVRAVGGYRSRLTRAQDTDLWLRLSEIGAFASVNRPLVRIRRHADQISLDESGRLQHIGSRMARTSHWLRRHGIEDPLAADAATFESFREWIANGVTRDRVSEYYAYVERAKARVATARASPSAIPAVIAGVLGEPEFLLRFVRQRALGDTTPRRLAREWIARGITGK